MDTNPKEGRLVVDEEGALLSLDPAAERIFGCRSEEAEGEPLSALISLADQSSIQALFNNGELESEDRHTARRPATGQRKGDISFPAEISLDESPRNCRRMFNVRVRDLSESAPLGPAFQTSGQSKKVMAELGLRVSRAGTIREAAQSIAEAAIQATDADVCQIFLRGDDGVFRVEAGAAVEKIPYKKSDSFSEFRSGEGLAGWVAEKRDRVVVFDVLEDPRWKRSPRTERWNLRSFAGFPIRWGRDIIGVFSVLRAGVRPFQPEIIESLDILANYASIALEKIFLIEEGRRRNWHLEIVGEIARAVGSTLKPEELFHTIVQGIRKAIPCERCAIASFDPESQKFHRFFEEGDVPLGPPIEGKGRRGRLIEEVYRTKRVLNVADLQVSRWKERRHARAGYRSVLVVPIVQEDRCIAHVILAGRKTVAFTEEHEALLTAIAGHLGSAIRNTILFQEAEKRASRLELVGEIAQLVGSELEPDELFKTICQEIRKAIPFDRIVFGQYLRTARGYNFYHEESDELMGIPSDSDMVRGLMAEEVYRTKKSHNIPDLQNSPWSESRHAKAGYRAILAVPIIQDGECYAHLRLASKKTGAFTLEHESLLTDIAAHLGPALRNAQLFEESRNQASRLEIVGEIAKAIGSALEPEKLFQTIVREIRRVVPGDRCAIGAVDPQTCQWRYWHIDSDIDVPPPTQEEEVEGGKMLLRLIYEPKKSLLVNNPAENDSWAYLGKNGLQSSLVIPILMDNKCIAHLALSSLKPNTFSPEQEKLLLAIATHLGPAIRNASLYQEAEKRGDRLGTLIEVTKRLTQGFKLEEILTVIAEDAARIFDGEARFRMPEGGQLVVSAATPGAIERLLERIPANESISGHVFKTGKPFFTTDSENDPRVLAIRRGVRRYEQSVSLMCIPVKLENKVFGILGVDREAGFKFDGEALRLATSFADQAAIAIDKARLFRETNERSRRLATLIEVAQRLTRGLDLTDVLTGITEATALVFCSEAGIRLREGDELVRTAGTPSALRQMKKKKIAFGEGIAGQAAEKGEPAFSQDIATDARAIREEVAVANLSQCGAQLSVPLRLDNRIVGVFNIFREQNHVFTDDEIQLATSLGDQAAVAIENAQLYQESEERGKRLATLNQFNQKVTKNLNLFEVLESTVGAAMVMLKAEDSRIFLLDKRKENLILRASGGNIPIPTGLVPSIEISESISGWSFQTDQGVIVADVQNNPHWRPMQWEWIPKEEIRSVICQPLSQHGKRIGVILCISREKDFFTEKDLDLLGSFADQAAIAIENARLFEEVQERTAQLETARDEAEKINTAKGEFIANLSHELRSPLNAVLGFSDLLLMLVKDEKIVDIAEKIRGAGKHLTRMIEDLLDLDRIETGKFRLDLQETAINGLVEEMVKSRREQLPENFTLKAKIDSNCGTVVCGPIRINQILTNLIDNALKYSPEGGTIWVRTQAAPGEVQITVEDEGLGMTPDEINVIFERFSQLESGTNRRAGGLGLGLSIVKKMLELHDGRILVKSTKGVGSAFSFVLPMIAVKNPSAQKKPGSRTGSGKTGPEPWSGKNILVVDNLEHNHEYVKILMESARKIVSAYNGEEGIEAARRERPDLIFMDLRMPVLDGFEAIRRLKSSSDTRDIPVLAVTAQAMDEDRERCLALGVDGFITKPIDLEIFQKKIEEVLGIQ